MRRLLSLIFILLPSLYSNLDEKYCDLITGDFCFTPETQRSDAVSKIKLPIYYRTPRTGGKSGWHYLENLRATYKGGLLEITLDSGERLTYNDKGKHNFVLEHLKGRVIYPDSIYPLVDQLKVVMPMNEKGFTVRDSRGYSRHYEKKKGWWQDGYVLKELIDHNGLITSYYYDKEYRPTYIDLKSKDKQVVFQSISFTYDKQDISITSGEEYYRIRWKKNDPLLFDSIRTDSHVYQFRYLKSKNTDRKLIDRIIDNGRVDVRVEYSGYSCEEDNVARLYGFKEGVEHSFCRYSYGACCSSMIRFDDFQKRIFLDEDGLIERYEQFDTSREAQNVTYFSYKDGFLVAQAVGNIDGVVEKATVWDYNDQGYKVSERIIGNISGYDDSSINLNADNYPDLASHDCFETFYKVDSFGRVIERIEPTRVSTALSYLGSSDLILSSIERDDHGGMIRKIENTYTRSGLKETISVEDLALGCQFTTVYCYNEKGLMCEETDYFLEQDSCRLIENSRKAIEYDNNNNITKESVVVRDLGEVSLIKRKWHYKKKYSENSNGLERRWEYNKDGQCCFYFDEESGVNEKYLYDQDFFLRKKEVYFENDVIAFENYSYDQFQEVCEIQSKNNKKQYFIRDGLQRIVEKRTLVDGEQYVENYKFDLFGRAIEYINGLGARTEISFNIFGSPIKESLPSGLIEEKFYTTSNHLCFSRDNCQREFEYSVDCEGHIYKKRMVFPEEREIESRVYISDKLIEEKVFGEEDKFYAYNERGLCTERSVGKKQQEITYNALGEEIVVEEPYVTYLFKRDLKGNILEEKSINHNGDLLSLQRFSFDKRNNLVKRTIYSSLEKEHTTSYLYNSLNLQTKIIDPLGAETLYYYDFGDKKRKVTVSPLKVKTIEEYDLFGNLVVIEKEDSSKKKLQRVKIGYNCEHEKISQNSEVILDGKVIGEEWIEWDLDLMGNVCKEERRRGGEEFVTAFIYNRLGKKQRLIKSDAVVVDYVYDCMDQLVELSSSDGTIDYQLSYNNRGLLIGALDLISHQKLLLEYDEKGNKTFESLPNGLDLQFNYDQCGKRKSMVLPDQSGIDYYYENDRLVRIKRHKETTQYEHRYKQYSLTGQVLKESYYDDILDVSYDYDHYLRLASVFSKYFQSTHVKRDREGRSLEVSGCDERSFIYSPLGQIKEESGFSYSHDSNYDRLDCSVEEEQFDLGMRLSKKDNKTFSYDALDRLIEIQDDTKSIYYTYDFFNRMMSRKEVGYKANNVDEVYYLYDAMEEIGEYDINKEVKNLRVIGAEEKEKSSRAVSIEMDYGIYLPLYDPQGSIRGLFDPQTMSVVSITDYSSFGEVIDSKGELFSPWGYKGLRVDRETNLLCYTFRFYDPKRGMFIQPDQYRPHIIFSPYHYCYNDPLNYYEVYGLDAIKDDPYSLLSSDDNQNVIYNKYLIRQLDVRNSENISQVFAVGSHNVNNERRAFLFVNGVNTTARECNNVGINMAYYLGAPVICIHNCPGNRFSNITRLFQEFRGVETKPVALLKETLINLDKNDVQEVHLFCHSEGALITKRALEGVSEDIRRKVEVYSFGGLELIPSSLGKAAKTSIQVLIRCVLCTPKNFFINQNRIELQLYLPVGIGCVITLYWVKHIIHR